MSMSVTMASGNSALASLLPTFHNSRGTLRLREKYILSLICATFIVFCIGGVFFLPELKAGTQFAYRSIRDAGPDLLGLIPPVERHSNNFPIPKPRYQTRPTGGGQGIEPPPVFPIPVTARARVSDIQRLAEKIRHEINLTQFAVLPRPLNFDPKDRINNELSGNGWMKGDQNNAKDWEPITFESGEDPDDDIRRKRDKVKEMMKFAWNNYVKYAWGENELRPISRSGHSAGIFGKTTLGATVVDAMDTLYIMGLKDEFKAGRDWIEENISLNGVQSEISVFETTIRFVGGLLTCYSFTKDKVFLDKAEHIVKKILPAFNTPKGLPNALINPRTGFSKNYAWASGGAAILSEIGTLHLEFVYLSDMTNNPIYKEKVYRVRDFLHGLQKPNGLYPNYISPKTGRWGQHHISMGALGDSFYEYLLKAWIQSGGRDIQARKMYDEAIEAIEKNLLKTSSASKLLYLAEMKYDRLEHKMDHLACFAGGMFALGAQSMDQKPRSHFVGIGAGITNTCHESYKRTPTGLGPESFRFTDNVEARASRQTEKYYIQRPEVVESYFYLWRLTKDRKYRDWAWEAVQALDRYCRVDSGFSGLKNVYDVNGPKDDVQQSFFLAETLKYLYLIFSNDDLINLDSWVFNTEAHPLPIKGKNPAYPVGINDSEDSLINHSIQS